MFSFKLFYNFTFIAVAEDDFGHERAAAEAAGALFAVWAGGAHAAAEAFKGFAVPRLLDGHVAQGDLVALVLVKTARDHDHIRTDIATVATALAGVERFRQNGLAKADRTRDIAAVHTDLERMRSIDLGEELRHARVGYGEHVRLRTLSRGLVQEEDDGVDAFREIVAAESVERLVDAVLAEHIVDVRLDARIEQHVDRAEGIFAPVPADRDRAAVFLAECGDLGGHAVARGGTIRHEHILLTDFEDLFEMLVLVGVAPAAEGKLIAAPSRLLRDDAEIFDGHIRLFDDETALVAADARLDAQSRFAVHAMPHDADIDQMRIRRHERINTRILAVRIEDARADIHARFGIKTEFEIVFFVMNDIAHDRSFRLINELYEMLSGFQ